MTMYKRRGMDLGNALGQGLSNFAQAYMSAKQRAEDKAFREADLALQQYKQLAEESLLREKLAHEQNKLASREKERQFALEQWGQAIDALHGGDIATALKALGPYALDKGDISKLLAMRYGEHGIGVQNPFGFRLDMPLVQKFQEGTTAIVTPSHTGEVPPGMEKGRTKFAKTATPTESKPKIMVDKLGNVIQVYQDGQVKVLRPGPGVLTGTPGGGKALVNPEQGRVTTLIPGQEKPPITEKDFVNMWLRAASVGKMTPFSSDEIARVMKEAAETYRSYMGSTPSLPMGIKTFSSGGLGWLEDEEEEE